MFTKVNDIYLIACTKMNVNPAIVFELLYKIKDICLLYFGEELKDTVIKNNIILIYEILDEMIDFGVP